MQVRLSVAVWMEADSLSGAEAALGRLESAGRAALGQAARADEATGAWSHAELIPADAAAEAAFAAAGLGPGITSSSFTAGLEPPESAE